MRLCCCTILLAGCASYRALPPEPGGPLRYERTRFLLFKSVKDDVVVERIFSSGPRLVAAVSRPESGVFVSNDGGASWTFAPLEPLEEVIFDGERLLGRAAARLYRSDDGGRIWSALPLEAGPIDALALGADRALYAAAQDRLFVSADGGRSFRALTLQVAPPFRIRSIAPDPQRHNAIYVSLRAEGRSGFLARVGALLDRTSDESLAALALVDGDAAPRFGDARDGVYATYDGGALWKKTDLALDSWLAFDHDALYAVAADPLLQAAALSRRYPDLATALERQLHGDRADAASLRAACRFPGREALLGVSGLVYRAGDAALSWKKISPAPPALFAAVERQRLAQGEWFGREEIPSAPAASPPPSAPPARGGRGIPRRSAPAMRRAARTFSPEALLSLLDPVRLLAHFNAGFPLTGAAREGEIVYAYAPTPAFWDLLARSAALAGDAEGEISLGPGWPRPQPGMALFELLRSADGGLTWSALAAQPPATPAGVAPYPSSIAPGLVVLSGREKDGEPWSALWRYLP